MSFTSIIINWYQKNKRDLPWRGISDPYLIWLSEIIMQQTRVEQGLPYYMRFSEKYPNVKLLAKADEKEILKLWQGLGYYSRARNLHATAKVVVKEHKGIFPKTFDEIIKLKGIGQYTAGAIASFAFGEAKPVVDGNVFRILSRYFGIKTAIDSTKGKKEFYALAEDLLDKKNPGTFNQAIMEFGSRQCTPKNSECENCPLNNSCYAFSKKQIEKFPVKEKETKIRNRYFYYLVVRNKGKVMMKRRTEKDIWKGLYDFPLIETEKQISINKFFERKEAKKVLGNKKFSIKNISPTHKHVLSHQNLFVRFIEINSKLRTPNSELIKDFKKIALPRIIEKYLDGM